MSQYKVLGADGTDENFDTHEQAFEFIESLNTWPKILYRIIDDKKLGELNAFSSFFDGENIALLTQVHHHKNYERVVI